MGVAHRTSSHTAGDTLAKQIVIIYADSGGTYGSPRMTVELRDQGVLAANREQPSHPLRRTRSRHDPVSTSRAEPHVR